MDTAAACRTYNVLLAEGRSVVAALLFAAPRRQPFADDAEGRRTRGKPYNRGLRPADGVTCNGYARADQERPSRLSDKSFMTPAINKPVPEFEALATGGVKFTPQAYAGKIVVLYFYPKDNTPGCTTEAMQFRDHYKEFVKAGAVAVRRLARQHGVARPLQAEPRAAVRADRRHRRKALPHVRRGQEQDHVRQEGQGHRAQHLPDRRQRRPARRMARPHGRRPRRGSPEGRQGASRRAAERPAAARRRRRAARPPFAARRYHSEGRPRHRAPDAPAQASGQARRLPEPRRLRIAGARRARRARAGRASRRASRSRRRCSSSRTKARCRPRRRWSSRRCRRAPPPCVPPRRRAAADTRAQAARQRPGDAVRARHQRADARPDVAVPLRRARHLPADDHARGARRPQARHDRGRAQRAPGEPRPRRARRQHADARRRRPLEGIALNRPATARPAASCSSRPT